MCLFSPCSTEIGTGDIDKMCKKSLANVDLDSIEYTPKNLPKIKKLLEHAQTEIITLHRNVSARRIQVYRCKSE